MKPHVIAAGILGLAALAAGAIVLLGTGPPQPTATASPALPPDSPATPVGAGFTPALPPESPDTPVGAGFTPALPPESPDTPVGAGFTPALPPESPEPTPEPEPTPDDQSLLDSLDEEATSQSEGERALLRKVRDHLTAFQFDEAVARAEAAVERWPKSGWARVAVAWTLAERGRWWDAFQAYDEALAIDSALYEGHLHQGRLAAVRANARAEQDTIAGEPLDPARWTPFLGGSWEAGDESGHVVGRLQGLIDQGLCGVLWHEPVPAEPFTLSVEVDLSLPAAGERGAGLAIGLSDARSGLYLSLHSYSARSHAGNPQDEAFRTQHGVWPRLLKLAQIQGDVSGFLQQWAVVLPEEGWARLQVRVRGPVLEIQLGELSLPPLTNGGGVSGRLGLIKLGRAEARYRNFSLTTD